MLSGTIDVSGQIHIPVDLIATHGEKQTLDALLDTGFTGSLGISRRWRAHWGGNSTVMLKLRWQAA